MGVTGLPGAKPHGSDICVSTPWASEYVIKRVIPMGSPRNVYPMGVHLSSTECQPHGLYSCVNPMGVRTGSLTASSPWVGQERITHGRPFVVYMRCQPRGSYNWLDFSWILL